MPVPFNPALTAFVSQINDKLVFGQVLITRSALRCELRHIEDTARSADDLREIRLDQLRELAQFTAAGAFRPLKSAPTLRPGWKLILQSDAELQVALNHLYPGAVADWYAALPTFPPVTEYREFVNRQTGMYRIAQKLTDAQAAAMIRACCHKRFCLKRRLWTVCGLEPDAPAEKSLIPCLEPCALLLEFARKSMRLEQEGKLHLSLAPSDLATMLEGLRSALASPNSAIPEANMNAPLNPRRVQRVLQQLEDHVNSSAAKPEDEPDSEEGSFR